jgi:hypothetical protein
MVYRQEAQTTTVKTKRNALVLGYGSVIVETFLITTN